MRLATLGVAVVLLVGMTPALAHTASTAQDNDDDHHTQGNTDNGYHEITSDIPYRDEILVEDDAYLKGGWWADGGLGEGTSVSASGPSQEEQITWLYIPQSPDEENPEDPYEVTVEVEGSVVAALDVFRVYDDGKGLTPDCPQYLAEELYPGENEGPGWSFRVLREGTQYHQRGAAAQGVSEMNVQLAPDESTHGYIVAVYPQAGSGALTEDPEDAKITTTVGFDGDDFFVLRDQAKNDQQPDEPFHINTWAGGTQAALDCGGEGIDLPPQLQSNAAEMPGTEPVAHQVGELLQTAIKVTP